MQSTSKIKRSPKLDSLTLFRSREEDNIKKFIFKTYSLAFSLLMQNSSIHKLVLMLKVY